MNKKDISSFGISTQITQLGRNPQEQTGFVNTPIYRGSTVIFNTVDDIVNNRAVLTMGQQVLPLLLI